MPAKGVPAMGVPAEGAEGRGLMLSIDLLRPDLADRFILTVLVSVLLAVILIWTAFRRQRERAGED
jgi:hypothetical protein